MTILLVILIVILLLGGLPAWNRREDLGYGPLGGIGLLVVILLVLLLMGRI